MLRMGIIESALTEWASKIVFRPEEGRLATLFRRLPEAQRSQGKRFVPIIRMDGHIYSLGEARMFYLDANAYHWQVAIDPMDLDKTGFTSLYRFTRTPFGSKNAPVPSKGS